MRIMENQMAKNMEHKWKLSLCWARCGHCISGLNDSNGVGLGSASYIRVIGG